MTCNLVFIHLLNDYSGSTKVLRETIRATTDGQGRAKLYLGSSGEGFLTDSGIPTIRYGYRRTGTRALTFVTYFFSQIVLFCKLLGDRTIDRNAVIYVNTLLPFGAALYGRLSGRKVIYHFHEISITPALLKGMLTWIARMTSSLNLYVSDAHMQALPILGVPAQRIHNALDTDFIGKAAAASYAHHHDGCFNVLMIASLRDYKGVQELLGLALATVDHREIRFHLVVNDEGSAIDRYFVSKVIPPNFAIYPRTTDTAAFFRNASLVLNLSRVDQCVETFGLTILEAMAFGIPVIVPPLGGPAELVVDGIQGFLVDSRDQGKLLERVLQLSSDPQLCLQMSKACRERAADFSPTVFAEKIVAALEGCQIWSAGK